MSYEKTSVSKKTHFCRGFERLQSLASTAVLSCLRTDREGRERERERGGERGREGERRECV